MTIARNYRHFLMLLALLVLQTAFSHLQAQKTEERFDYDKMVNGQWLKMIIEDGDTIRLYEMEPVSIYAERTHFKNAKERRKYGRLKRYVVKVYPYAKVAGELLQDFDDTLSTIHNKAKRKKYLKKVEEELKKEFSGELKKLTIRQGIILVKLIDRETGNTSYELIKSLRGSFSAFLWQSLARLFGSNLKLEYDPKGEDAMIEEIVLLIENGQIPYQPRKRKS